MQRCSHSFNTATALRSIFFPTSNQNHISTFLAPSFATDFVPRSPLPYYQSRSVSSYGGGGNSYASSRTPSRRPGNRVPQRPQRRISDADLRKFGVQNERKPKDDEIEGDTILLVQDQGSPRHVSLQQTLRSIDREKYFIVQVGVEGGEQEDFLEDEESEDGEPAEPRWVAPVPRLPVCKIMERKNYFVGEQKRGKKGGTGGVKTKELEFSWNIDKNDLSHRLVKAEDFLADGKKVEIFLAPKKRSKPIVPEEAAALVRLVRERLLEHKTVKESKPMEGEIGKQVTLFFEKKPA